MKTLFFLLFFLGLQSWIFAQNIAFEDNNFKQTLIQLGIDTSGDGEISTSEAEAIDSLTIRTAKAFSSFKELESFKNLKYLHLSQFTLSFSTAIDPPGLVDYNSFKNLEHLVTSYTDFDNSHSFSIENHPKIKIFECNSGFSNASLKNCENLEKVICSLEFMVKLENCPKIKELKIGGHLDFRSFDASPFPELTNLDCSFSNLSELNVSQNINLAHLDCSHSGLSSLDVSKNINLTHLNTQSMFDIQYVCVVDAEDAKNNPNFMKDFNVEWRQCLKPKTHIVFEDKTFEQTLIDLGFDINNDNGIDTTEVLAIDTLIVDKDASFTDISELKIFTNLTYLSLNNFSITSNNPFLEFNSLPKLNYLEINNISFKFSPLVSLNLKDHSVISSVNINRSIFGLKLENCSNLKFVKSTYTEQFPSITNCPNITEINIDYGTVTFPSIFDFGRFPLLKKVSCIGAYFINLDFSKNTQLTHLNCTINGEPAEVLKYVYVHDLQFVQNNPNFLKDAHTEWAEYEEVNNDNILFEDTKLKQFLIDLGIDTNKDNEISISEAKVLKSLNLDNSNISNIEGLQNFVNLETLILSNNSISRIDLNELNKLIVLNLSNNDFSNSNNRVSTIQSLDFSNNLNLEELNVSNTKISSLDVSMLTKLTHLDVTENPSLTHVCVADVKATEQNPNFKKDEHTEWRNCGIVTSLGTEENIISIYPNPTNDLLQISGNNISNIQIISLNGNVLIDSVESIISLSNLPQGVYIAKVVVNGVIIPKRVIKL